MCCVLHAVPPGHLSQDEFDKSFLMSKEITIPTTFSEYNVTLPTLALQQR